MSKLDTWDKWLKRWLIFYVSLCFVLLWLALIALMIILVNAL